MSRIDYVTTENKVGGISIPQNHSEHTIEKDWIYEGYRCVVVANHHMGHRCGYVGVNKNHPLYGVNYSDKPKILQKKINELRRQELGKRGVIDLFCWDGASVTVSLWFNVHGGLTYSGGGQKSEYPVKSDLWFFGYDCGHCDDRRDMELIKNESLREMELQFPMIDGASVKTLEYCIRECECMAEQLKLLEKKWWQFWRKK
jgi:hypothetical protein